MLGRVFDGLGRPKDGGPKIIPGFQSLQCLKMIKLTQYQTLQDITDRTIEETLEIGWKLLAILPKSELKRIRDEYIEKYLPKEGVE